jgi:hypothetical protein
MHLIPSASTLSGHLVSGFKWGSEAAVTHGYHFGISYYTRIFRMLRRIPEWGQSGIFGQWIQDFNIHGSGGPFNSIEGGLFNQDKIGKVLNTQYCYRYRDTFEADACSYSTRLLLTHHSSSAYLRL